MKNRYSSDDQLMSNGDLTKLLKRYDPISVPDKPLLASLERNIDGQIDALDKARPQTISHNSFSPTWIIRQSLSFPRLAFASILIITAGFYVGQTSFYQETAALTIESPTLLAFADDPILLSIPTTNTRWGDTSDDAE